MKTTVPLLEVRWMLDRVWMLFATLPLPVGALAAAPEYRKAEDPIVRQQLKWLRNGTSAASCRSRCSTCCRTRWARCRAPTRRWRCFRVALIPLTLAYAIVRYRLMDVDIIFRRGYAYTLATICVLAAFYGLVFSLGRLVQKNFRIWATPA